MNTELSQLQVRNQDAGQTRPLMIVIFGRPGAGKSTICQEVTRLLTAKDSMDAPTTTAPDYLYLDLDVCVPQWMRLVVIISFSFVNIDMRISFRERYPYSHWILVDTTQHVAEERIAAREGHFYKGAQTNENAHSKQGGNLENNTTSQMDDKTDIDEGENSEWEFQPVAFDHAVLDGCDTINYNATRIAELIHSCQNKAQRAWL
eukprot:CCRYP_005098-RB/>CCRYP_005098-RB protein AED:0.18 eAED:0.18 QI:252/0.5/0.66/1/1/1/3/0/203